jgi:hypothetical protein
MVRVFTDHTKHYKNGNSLFKKICFFTTKYKYQP